MRRQGKKTEQTTAALIGVISELASELHPEAPRRPFTLDSSLDREVGLDSLARMELLSRLEERFGVVVSERTLAEAETVRDLLRAVLGASPAGAAGRQQRIAAAVGDAAGADPHDAATLIEVLDWHLKVHPDRPHVHFYADEGEGEVLSYRQLGEGAKGVAAGLSQYGLQPGEPVAIMLPTGTEYLCTFFGILLAGGVPVPIYPPVRMAQMEDHLRRQRSILGNCGAAIMVTMAEAVPFARLLKSQLPSLKHLATVEQLTAAAGRFEAPRLMPESTAFLQYTSGSTGNPKGVVLSHSNLLANIRAMGEAVEVGAGDVIVSWLPLYHDMGLIGTWLSSLYFGLPLVLLSPLDFLARPSRWLWAIHRYRGTLSPAPNFAYEICMNKVRDEDVRGLDLSSWRGAFNGAEPVSPDTLERFCERFVPFGFRREAMMPVYGLAECSVGLAFPPLGRGPLVDLVSRETFSRTGLAEPARAGDEALRFVACGQPLKGHEIRIVDAAGRELSDRRQGQVQFYGPSACSGYFRNPEQTAGLFRGEWLDTGDLGYMAAGDIYITGRVKDVVIVAGRNIYPQELEEAVGNLPGIRKGNVAVFAATDRKVASERLVVLAETRETRGDALEQLHEEISALAVDLIGAPPGDLVLAPPQTIPKTSSGKVRRSACRQLYERGLLKRKESRWRLAIHLAFIVAGAQARQAWQTLSALAFAGYAWSIFCLAAVVVWLAVVLLPVERWRWSVMRSALRLLAWATGTRLSVKGLERLPGDRPCIIVANHASYLDVYLLVALLPIDLNFVAKAELRRRPYLRLPLQRLGTEFVERFDRRQGVEGARRISQRARRGSSLFFFPEGTFSRAPGLRPFRMGAFLAAAESGLPVVPVAIRGTRSMLVGDSWFPRRGRLSLQIGKAIEPDSTAGMGEAGDLWRQALKLRSEGRRFIADHCGEPDLKHRS